MRFTDREFFDLEIEHGFYPGGSTDFYEVHEKLAKFIIQHKPKIHADLGGGNSPLTKILQDNGIEADLFEKNPYSCNLQKIYGVNFVVQVDFIEKLNEWCKVSFPYDSITAIEVFEHIEDEKLLPFVSELANSCKYFIFSSTPNKDTPEFDEQWGHINIKSTNEWVRIFESNDFELLKEETKYLQKNCIPTTWTLMFKSKMHA